MGSRKGRNHHSPRTDKEVVDREEVKERGMGGGPGITEGGEGELAGGKVEEGGGSPREPAKEGGVARVVGSVADGSQRGELPPSRGMRKLEDCAGGGVEGRIIPSKVGGPGGVVGDRVEGVGIEGGGGWSNKAGREGAEDMMKA